MDSVALVCGTGHYRPQECNRSTLFLNGHVVVLDSRQNSFQLSELVVVGGEDGLALDNVMKVLGDGPGDGQTVKGAGAPAHLVQEDQAVLAGVVKDVGKLSHLNHEGGLAGR